MSGQQRFIQLPLVGTIFLCLFASGYLIYLVTGKRSSKPKSPAAITKHTVNTSSEEALKYWTTSRKRNAKPAEMPHVGALDLEKQDPQ